MSTKDRGFTLLEVILAVLIIAMVAVTVQRFVSATMTGIAVSTERQQEVESMNALFRFVRTQLDEVPPRGQSLIMGYEHSYTDRGGMNTDELQWRCVGGQGTLTAAADGEWYVTLMLREQQDDRRKLELGLRRRNVDSTNERDWNWVPIMRDVAGLKFDYFDPRLNTWITSWKDANAKPLLVRMQLWRTRDSAPEMATFSINSSQVTQ